MTVTSCARCGGISVQIVDWTRPNDDEVVHDDPYTDGSNPELCWCEDCEDHVLLEMN